MYPSTGGTRTNRDVNPIRIHLCDCITRVVDPVMQRPDTQAFIAYGTEVSVGPEARVRQRSIAILEVLKGGMVRSRRLKYERRRDDPATNPCVYTGFSRWGSRFAREPLPFTATSNLARLR